MTATLLRRLGRIETARLKRQEANTGNADCSALRFVTVTRGVDGVLRDFHTGEAVPDDPPLPGVPCGEFRFLTTLGETS